MQSMAALCFAGCVVSGLFSVGFFIRKDRTAASTSVAVLLLSLCASLGAGALRYQLERPPVPFLTPLSLMGLMVHRLFTQIARLSTERKRHGLVILLLLLPAVIFDVLAHGFGMQEGAFPAWGPVISVLHVIVALSVIAPCAASLFHVFGFYTPRTMSGLAWVVLGISGFGLAALLTGLIGMAIGDSRMFAVIEGFASTAVIAGALAFFRWPDALGRFRDETVKRRYSKSLLSDLDVGGLIRGMEEMVLKTRIYRDESCSLEELAGRMGLSRHQVSELLNDRMGTNYSTFINGFRIHEAGELLRGRPDMTVLEIALEVGFGNKTSFNEAFRRSAGMSPTDFRKKEGQER
jgi:AraC-like DNA-binding protein